MSRSRFSSTPLGCFIPMTIACAILCVGWVLNLINVFNQSYASGDIDGMVVMRVIGVLVAPIGGVLGFL